MAVILARQYEQVKSHIQKQRGLSVDAAHVKHELHRSDMDRYKREGKSSTCGRCGYVHKRGSCPAEEKKRMKCGKFSHFARVCRTKSVNEVYASEHQTRTPFFVGSVQTNEEPPWRVNLEIRGRRVNFNIDT